MDFIKKTSPKDVFLHLLAAVTLYAAATSFLVLAFQYINIKLPDILQYTGGALGMMRWALATLIVVFPVYLFSMRMLVREYSRNPEKREMRIRKWLVYFTLFAAALIIIGDFVSLIYNFLQGDITAQFLLKTLAVFVVAGAVFGFYLRDIRDKALNAKLFAYVVSAILLIAVVAGFFAVGSPFKERTRRFDDMRVNDLQTIQGQIVYYWQSKDKLPANLLSLNDELRGYTVPGDPVTQEQYGYERTGVESFKLCATFSLPSRDTDRSSSPRGYGIEENWTHKEGLQCFARTIDKDYFKPLPAY